MKDHEAFIPFPDEPNPSDTTSEEAATRAPIDLTKVEWNDSYVAEKDEQIRERNALHGDEDAAHEAGHGHLPEDAAPIIEKRIQEAEDHPVRRPEAIAAAKIPFKERRTKPQRIQKAVTPRAPLPDEQPSNLSPAEAAAAAHRGRYLASVIVDLTIAQNEKKRRQQENLRRARVPEDPEDKIR